MVQIKNVITGSAAMVGAVGGLLYCFITNKRVGGPTVGASVMYAAIGAIVAGGLTYAASRNIEEETTDEKFT